MWTELPPEYVESEVSLAGQAHSWYREPSSPSTAFVIVAAMINIYLHKASIFVHSHVKSIKNLKNISLR